MSLYSRQLVAATVMGAVFGGWPIYGLGSMTFHISEGIVTAVHPGANTVEIGHRTCRLPPSGAMGAGSSGSRTTINDVVPGMTVRYSVTGNAKGGCTIRMLWPVKPTQKE
jgi:hypothetical protein